MKLFIILFFLIPSYSLLKAYKMSFSKYLLEISLKFRIKVKLLWNKFLKSGTVHFHVCCFPIFKCSPFTNRMRMILSVGDETFAGIGLCTFSGSLIAKMLLLKNFSSLGCFSWIPVNKSDKWGEIFTVGRKFRNQMVLYGLDGII